MTLDELYSASTGERIGDHSPGDVQISQYAMRDHPFIWALDAFVFAGPDAHKATQVYAQAGSIATLDVDVYRIESTDADKVMTLSAVQR